MSLRRTDGNQKEIVAAFRKCGAFVFDLHTVGKGCPDLLVAYAGRWHLVEVKTEKGKLRESQIDFGKQVSAPIWVLRAQEGVEPLLKWWRTFPELEEPVKQ